ncbi:MAG: tRNA uridine-5-carboxymethylaminomethyl(34) synthesis GTPase MnmE [Thermodesulfobacteriota bacterium]
MNKDFLSEQTIAAISTPEGEGGISVIRVSGSNAENILKLIFKNKADDKLFESRRLYHGDIINPKDSSVIDSVLITIMRAPNSYTGEDVVEIYSHGGKIIPQKILQLITGLESRVAMPGEFTQRAYLNAKMDLAQAEAVADIINAQSEISLMQAEKQLRGELSGRINSYKDKVLDIYAEVEAQIDFPDEAIDPVIKHEIIIKSSDLLKSISDLINTFDTGKIIKNGVFTTILGKPNVGKSSILNTILKEDRAIVSNLAGTTRDFIEESININGIILKLVDTAGIRPTRNQIEKVGVDIALEKAHQSEFIIIVLDAGSELDNNDIEVLKKGMDKNHIVIVNKIDLEQNLDIINLKKYVQEDKIVYTSVKENIGFEEMKEKIYALITGNQNITEGSELYLTEIRHKNALEKAKIHLDQFLKATNQDKPLEIMSMELRSILDYLGEITGEVTNEDLLGRIFSKFCIGK